MTKKPSKKLVTRYKYINLDNSIDELLIKLQKAKAEGWEANELCAGPDEYSDIKSNYLIKQELETDKEYATRIAIEKQQEQQTFERERREFERLSKKFSRGSP